MKNRKIIVAGAVIVLVLLGGLAAWRFGALDRLADSFGGHADGAAHADGDHDEHSAEEEGHEGEGHEGEGHEEELVRLTPEELDEMGVKLTAAGPGRLQVTVTVPGEVVVNADRVAHVVPRVSGVVRAVRKRLGDTVTANEVMAELESRELASAQATFLAARERLALAKTTLEREEKLWKEKVSAEQEYLAARQAHAEAVIEMHSAEQNLHVLGVTHEYLQGLTSDPDQAFEPYRLTAPIAGTVIEKHITLGEKLDTDATAFTVADLSEVWINLTVYQKDIESVAMGQPVTVRSSQGGATATGKIDYVSPIVDEATRTAIARVVVDNSEGRWRPGMFVTGEIELRDVESPVAVPRDALQTVEGRTVVFVQTPEGIEASPVTIGRENHTHVEITSGLEAGQQYAVEGSFVLKAELGKGSFGGGHAH